MGVPLDYITVLTTKGPLATKRITAVQGGPPNIEGYGKAKLFNVDQVPVSSFDEMIALLDTLLQRPQSFLVRGKLADGVDPKNAMRRVRPRGNEPATLLVQPRHWLALDIDSVPCPSNIDPIWEPDAVVEHVVELLPEEFHGVSVFWAFTSGHGIKPGIRLRFFFWLDRALSDAEVKAWLAKPIAEGLIDAAIYSPAQPTYTAQPVFVGMPDPVPHRSGVWRGYSDAVEVPVIEKPQPKAQHGSSAAAGSTAAGPGDGGSYEAYRAKIGDGEGRGGFHPVLKKAIGAFIGAAGVNADTAWLRADLEQAIHDAPRDPALHGDDYIEIRVSDLDAWIAWTLDRQKEKKGPRATAAPVEPTYPKPSGTAEEVRAEVIAPAMDRFYAAAEAWHARPQPQPLGDFNSYHPPVHAIAATTGLGKTSAFLKRVAVPAVQAGRTVGIANPRHKLGDQMVRDLVALGITAEVYRGREADDPERPGEKMCLDLPRVKAIEGALQKAGTFACKYKENKCKFFYICGYQKQRTKTPQVWIFAHQLLRQEQPEFMPKLDILAIDEAFWDCFIRRSTLDLPSLVKSKFVPKRGKGKRSILGDNVAYGRTSDLLATSYKVHQVISTHPEGLLSRQAFIDAGVTPDEIRHAYNAEWQRKLDLENVLPGVPLGDVLMACAEIEEHNKEVYALAMFWKLLAQTLEGDFNKSPWLSLWQDQVSMTWSDEVHESWNAPTMIMDACLPEKIDRRFFPLMEKPTQAVATMPHAYVRQITDRVMARNMFIPREGAREKDKKTCAANVKRLRHYIEVRAAESRPGRVLVVVQKDVEDALLKLGSFSSNVSLAHFNDLTGLNDWENVAGVVVVGRTEPSPATVESSARAVFGAEITTVEPDEHGRLLYPRVTRGVRMRDGCGVAVENSQHPDPLAEAMRWATAEAEALQAVGRGRGVNRGAANPVWIDILTNLVLPGIEVDEVTTWDAIQPSLVEIMAARGAVPGSYADMAACYPDLFASWNAARMALDRENPAQTPIEDILYRRLCRVSWTEVSYRRAGSRGPASHLRYDPGLIADPATWLTLRLGGVTLLGPPYPVDATERARLAEPAALPIRLSTKDIEPLPVATPRTCAWFVPSNGGDGLRHCGEPITDGLDWCPTHRFQYAETLLAPRPVIDCQDQYWTTRSAATCKQKAACTPLSILETQYIPKEYCDIRSIHEDHAPAAQEPSIKIRTLASTIARLVPNHRDPERFHLDKDEITAELRRLARELAS